MIMNPKESIWEGKKSKISFHPGEEGIQGESILGSLPVLKVTKEGISQ